MVNICESLFFKRQYQEPLPKIQKTLDKEKPKEKETMVNETCQYCKRDLHSYPTNNNRHIESCRKKAEAVERLGKPLKLVAKYSRGYLI